MFLTSKSFVLLCLFMDRNMRKKYLQKHGKNISFCVSLKSSVFEVVIVNWGLEGSNLKILRPGRAHMPRNIQNYWFLTKKHHVKKSVPQIYNSPRALALNNCLFSTWKKGKRVLMGIQLRKMNVIPLINKPYVNEVIMN